MIGRLDKTFVNPKFLAEIEAAALARMFVPKLVCKVSDASRFGLVVRVNGRFSGQKHD